MTENSALRSASDTSAAHVHVLKEQVAHLTILPVQKRELQSPMSVRRQMPPASQHSHVALAAPQSPIGKAMAATATGAASWVSWESSTSAGEMVRDEADR